MLAKIASFFNKSMPVRRGFGPLRFKGHSFLPTNWCHPFPLPPEDLIKVTGIQKKGNYRKEKEYFFRLLLDHSDLSPDHHFLDLGCGCGGMTAPLVRYLKNTSSYTGLDIQQNMVDWALENITRRFPNFSFVWSDVHNSEYHRSGSHKPDSFYFPFKDGTFSFVLAKSLFTHMQPNGVENYLKEAARVLAPGGTMVSTYFLFDDLHMPEKKGSHDRPDFSHDGGDHRLGDRKYPDRAVAYRASHILKLHERAGLKVSKVVNLFQPMVIAKKGSGCI